MITNILLTITIVIAMIFVAIVASIIKDWKDDPEWFRFMWEDKRMKRIFIIKPILKIIAIFAMLAITIYSLIGKT